MRLGWEGLGMRLGWGGLGTRLGWEGRSVTCPLHFVYRHMVCPIWICIGLVGKNRLISCILNHCRNVCSCNLIE